MYRIETYEDYSIDRVTVVKFEMHDEGCSEADCSGIKIRTDSAKLNGRLTRLGASVFSGFAPSRSAHSKNTKNFFLHFNIIILTVNSSNYNLT